MEREPGGAGGADERAQRFLDARLPAADQGVKAIIERFDIGEGRRRVDIERVADEGEVAVAQFHRPAVDAPARRLLNHTADLHPVAGRKLTTRKPDAGEKMALKDAAEE